MPEGITKRRLVSVILLFGVDPEKDPKRRPKVNPEVNPGKDTEKKLKAAEKPHVRPAPVMPVLPCGAAVKVPVVRSPPESPLSTTPSSPLSPLSPVVVGPVAMGTVEEIKNALIEPNRLTAMPIPQIYGKKGEKPEDHIMKVEDYFQNYNIRDQEQNVTGLEILAVARLGHDCPL